MGLAAGRCAAVVAGALAGLFGASEVSASTGAAVVSYSPGTTANPLYSDPEAALGLPERFTGEGVFPSVVSPFSPPYGEDELVSIGEGGHLTLELAKPARNRASNAFGVDLILFGSGGFIDRSYPSGITLPSAAKLSDDALEVWVSSDGSHFEPLGEFRDARFPTLGFLDSGPYDLVPGAVPTDAFLPVNPALVPSDFASKILGDIVGMYAGSAGGTPVDISASGLSTVRFVRFSLADDGNAGTNLKAEIDAVTVVPAPGAGLGLLILAFGRRRR